jgi:uncharacterized membrane protein YccC
LINDQFNMILLSRRTKEAIKTALAMTIAYGIALSMNWDRPYWAAFAVAFVSLATIGQSLNKAALRMAGTLLAMIVALILIALFAQDRWPFVLALSAWVGFCTYMMGSAKHQYFWQVGGFVSVIICMDAGPDPAYAFETAILRAQETGLGILVYSLVSIFLWPSSSRADFEATACKLTSIQHGLFTAGLALLLGKAGDEKAPQRAVSIQTQTRFNLLLDAAESDSYAIRENRKAWRRYQQHLLKLSDTLERSRDSLADLQELDLLRLLPNLAAFGDEIESRFIQIQHMLAGQAPDRHPTDISVALDETALGELSHFHKAALVVSRKRMQVLESQTRALFDTISDIRGFGKPGTAVDTPAREPDGFIPDPERITSAVRAMLVLWLAWLSLVYIGDIPGGTGLVAIAGPFGMAISTMPQVPISKLFKPLVTSLLFASVLYIFLMPKLSGFIGLGMMIFATTFTLCYLFAEPRQMLGRVFGLALFIVIAGISNDQTYNFLTITTTAMMFVIIFAILFITAQIPFSPRPERNVLRLLGRFFSSCEYLMATMRQDTGHTPTRLERWKSVFHRRELATLPQKIGVWAGYINTGTLPGTTPQQVEALVNSLQVLGFRLQELLEERDTPQAPVLVQNLLADVRTWRLRAQDTFRQLSSAPDTGDQEALRTGLEQMMARLDSRIHETLDRSAGDPLSASQDENFYRLLGAYRGVSEALVEYTGNAGNIDWTGWREERFA